MNKKKTTVIHQPDFFPYLGFFHRLVKADLFIIFDHVQFVRRGWHNRDKIKYFDDVFTFDPIDEKKYGFKPNTNYFGLNEEEVKEIEYVSKDDFEKAMAEVKAMSVELGVMK